MPLTLYHFQGCPYCGRVRDFLSKKNIMVPMKDTHANPSFRDELIKIGGKDQVPCLVIDGKALYESSDIIEWFKKTGQSSKLKAKRNA
jgi:glutaredoxin